MHGLRQVAMSPDCLICSPPPPGGPWPPPSSVMPFCVLWLLQLHKESKTAQQSDHGNWRKSSDSEQHSSGCRSLDDETGARMNLAFFVLSLFQFKTHNLQDYTSGWFSNTWCYHGYIKGSLTLQWLKSYFATEEKPTRVCSEDKPVRP